MSAGTIALTNNSANVTGTGTAFTTELKGNDFIVVIVGGVTYTLGVKATTSATALTLITPYNGPTATGNAWTAVPNATLVGITAQVAADVAKAIRGLNLDKANWQQVFSGTGNITVTLPDGSTYTGPAWNGLTTALTTKADLVSGAVAIAQGGTGATTKAAAVTALGGFGTAAGNFAQGNDSRFGTVGGKTGGTISTAVTINGQITAAGTGGFYTQGANNPSTQGSYIGWNSTGLSGGSDFVCNQGGGSGGFRFRVVNAGNSSVITDFTMNPNGQGQSSGGWSATSDIDIKTNVVEIDPEEALEALAGWRTCSWDYRDTVSELNEDGKVTARVKGAKGFGYIAQDVQKNCPDAVTVTDNYTQHVADDGTAFLKKGVLSLNTLGVSAAYCGASIKALKKRNEDQAELIAVLLKRLEAVETNLGINGEPAS